MRPSVTIILFILIGASAGICPGTGILLWDRRTGIYAIADDIIVADSLPYSYNGSFVVFNDGYRDGVYIIRVSVSEPSAIKLAGLEPDRFHAKARGVKDRIFQFKR